LLLFLKDTTTPRVSDGNITDEENTENAENYEDNHIIDRVNRINRIKMSVFSV